MGEAAILSLPGQSKGSLGNRSSVEVGEGVSLYPPGSLSTEEPTPRVSHGGVSNQGRKTVPSISNWCLETIVLHATGRKTWGEWVSEPGLELVTPRLRQRESQFRFCTQASLDLSSLGLQSVSLSLVGWENGKKNRRKEVSTKF